MGLEGLSRSPHVGYCASGPAAGLFVLVTPVVERGLLKGRNTWELSFSGDVVFDGVLIEESQIVQESAPLDRDLVKRCGIVWAPENANDAALARAFPWYEPGGSARSRDFVEPHWYPGQP